MNSSAISSLPGRQSESLAAGDLLGFARPHAGAHLPRDFVEHLLGLRLEAAFLSEDHLAELLVRQPGDDRLDLGRAEHVLRLPLELRLGDAHSDDRHKAGGHIVALDALLGVLEADLVLARVVLDSFARLLDQRVEKAIDMHAAIGRLHHIDEAADDRVVVARPSQGDVDVAGASDLGRAQIAVLVDLLGFLPVLARAGDVPHVGHRFSMGQEIDKIDGPPLVKELLDTRMGVAAAQRIGLLRRRSVGERSLFRAGFIVGFSGNSRLRGRSIDGAGQNRLSCDARRGSIVPGAGAGWLLLRNVLVDDVDPEARDEETRLPDAVDEHLVVELRVVVEDLRVRPVADARACAAGRDIPDDTQLRGPVLARLLERRRR